MQTDRGHDPGNAWGQHNTPAAQRCCRVKTKDVRFLRPYDISTDSAAKQSIITVLSNKALSVSASEMLHGMGHS